MKKLIVGIALLLTLSACAGSGTRTVEGINQVIAEAGPNSIVISRNTGITGAIYRTNVLLNGEKIGTLGNDEVASFSVPQGRHTLEAQFEGPASIGVKKGVARFENDGTSPQYFTLTIKTGLIGAQFTLVQVTADSFDSTTRSAF